MSSQGPTQYISGLISNISWDEVVEKLIEVYRKQRITPLEKGKEAVSAKISLLGELKGKLSALKDTVDPFFFGDPFRTFSVTMSSPTTDPNKVLQALASRFTSEGTYLIEVIKLAQAHVLASDGFLSATEALGASGTLTVNGKEIQIEEEDSLFTVADKINHAKVGVKATVLKISDSEWKLVLQSEETGSINAIEVQEALEQAGEPFSFGFNTVVAAQDAELKVNGLSVTRSTNEISDLIKGVTLKLLSESQGAVITLEVKRDQEAVISKVEAFVKAYNEVASFLKDQFTYKQGEDKPLMADTSLRIIQANLGGLLLKKVEDVPNGYEFLGFFGVSLKKDGSLEFDPEKLKEKLSQDPEAVAAFFTKFSTSLSSYLNQLLDPYGGFLKVKGDSLNRQVEGYQRQIEAQEKLLEKEQQRLYRQFVALEGALGRIRSLSSWLAQQIKVSFKNYGGK